MSVSYDIFDQGTLVGEEARKQFPGGTLIDLPHNDPERVTRTRAAHGLRLAGRVALAQPSPTSQWPSRSAPGVALRRDHPMRSAPTR